MRKPVVAGNWKMNGNRAGISNLMESLLGSDFGEIQVLVFPSFVFLQQVSEIVKGSPICMGAQNVDWRAQGALTGEIEASMLKDVGCTHCLVGHSERRALFFETDEQVAEKYKACIANDLVPILCIGETLEQREQGHTMEVVSRQLKAVIEAVGISGIGGGIIAYEPVWAIGTGESASPEQANEVHSHIRAVLGQEDELIAGNVQILYGGSVNSGNAKKLFEKENIDGALVGGASLKSEDFLMICEAAALKMEE
jgi:triosephosphate isomerase (TIM)